MYQHELLAQQSQNNQRSLEEMEQQHRYEEMKMYFEKTTLFDQNTKPNNDLADGTTIALKQANLMPDDDSDEIWNVELKGMCTDQDLILFADLLVKFSQKFQGIGLLLMPANVNTIDQAKDVEIDEHYQRGIMY